MLAHIISKGFPHLEENDILEVLDSHTTELTEEDLEHMTVLCEREDEDSDAVAERPHLIA